MKNLNNFDEAATKQFIILRVLDNLGWNIYDINEVRPEYPVDPKNTKEKVDYALAQNTDSMVFVEAKAVGADLETEQKQFLNYCFSNNVSLGVLTNGLSWWLYLPREKGSWYERKFYSVDLIQQDVNTIVSNFEDFLSKQNISNGKALESAKKTLESKQKDQKIKTVLPQAWNTLITSEDESFVEALNKMVEKISGYRAQDEVISEFWEQNISKLLLNGELSVRATGSKISQRQNGEEETAKYVRKGFTGKVITAFTFNKERHPTKSWKELMLIVYEEVRKSHSQDFDKVLSLKGRKRPYFTKNYDELRNPEKIKGTDIFVETNLSSNAIVKLCEEVLSLFGYKGGLKIETD